MDDYISAFAREMDRNGAAEAFGGTGDQGDSSTELAAIGIGGGHRRLKK
jgi:hypothetical protein